MATFCLIHGQWHDGSSREAVVDGLHQRGHDAVAADIPFDDPVADNAARACPALQALDGIDGPIVVVGHSLASAEAALVAAERRPALLVHLCPSLGSFAPPPGAPEPFREGFPCPPRDAEGRGVWAPEAAIRSG